MSVETVLGKVREFGCNLVEITGGEPLVQKRDCVELARRLCDENYTVLIETGGSLDASVLDDRAVKILDVKCPGSGEAERNFWPNLERLGPRDEIKFVIRDRADFEYALDVIDRFRLNDRGPALLFSPAWGAMDLRDFAGWVLQSGVHARMQLQLHKYIWGPDAKGV